MLEQGADRRAVKHVRQLVNFQVGRRAAEVGGPSGRV
jgi:hypothetical protein